MRVAQILQLLRFFEVVDLMLVAVGEEHCLPDKDFGVLDLLIGERFYTILIGNARIPNARSIILKVNGIEAVRKILSNRQMVPSAEVIVVGGGNSDRQTRIAVLVTVAFQTNVTLSFSVRSLLLFNENVIVAVLALVCVPGDEAIVLLIDFGLDVDRVKQDTH